MTDLHASFVISCPRRESLSRGWAPNGITVGDLGAQGYLRLASGESGNRLEKIMYEYLRYVSP